MLPTTNYSVNFSMLSHRKEDRKADCPAYPARAARSVDEYRPIDTDDEPTMNLDHRNAIAPPHAVTK